MKALKQLPITISLLFTSYSYSLVDYTDYDASSVRTSRKSVKRSAKNNSISKRRTARRSTSGKKYLDFSTSFSNSKFDTISRSGKFDRLDFKASMATDYDLYLDVEYPMFSGRVYNDQDETSYQAGNPLVLMGLNWLQFGGRGEALNLDLEVGFRLSGSGEFASGRTDKIIGVSTSKRLGNVGLSFGYHYIFTGTSDKELESDIGNIAKVAFEAGWVVSSDIAFMIKAQNISLSKSDDLGRAIRLNETIKYSTITPKLQLQLASSVKMFMQAVFRMRRPKQEFLSGNLGLWHLDGLYGNSLSAGLGFDI